MGTLGKYYKRLEEDYIVGLLDPSGLVLLDMGTGTGRIAFALSQRAKLVIGMDISSEMLQVAQENRKDRKNLFLLLGDGENTPFQNSSFDAVISVGTFESIDDLSSVFRETARILKPGGRFLFTKMNQQRFRCFGWYSLGDDSRAHTLGGIRTGLKDQGLDLLRYQGTFFISPRFVGRYYKYLHWPFFQEPLIRTIIFVERLLERINTMRKRCGQFIILAEKSNCAKGV